jgi:hypothetical protein
VRHFVTAVALLAVTLPVAACGSSDGKSQPSQSQQVEHHAAKQKAYLPQNDVELKNYNAAQRLYDDPTSVLWCTFAFSNPSAPLVTVPVAGLFHPNPPQYRYGFTPGGQYVDFFNTETYCSSKPTKFQRQQTKVSLSVDPGLSKADTSAQAALKAGNKAEAQRILERAIGG